jgi:hypothetical protein
VRIKHLAVATAGAGAILITGGLALSSPASAATASAPAAPTCTHPCSSSPGNGWKYVDDYFWASDCITVGNQGISSGTWSRYQCKGSTWTNYDLWVN